MCKTVTNVLREPCAQPSKLNPGRRYRYRDPVVKTKWTHKCYLTRELERNKVRHQLTNLTPVETDGSLKAVETDGSSKAVAVKKMETVKMS